MGWIGCAIQQVTSKRHPQFFSTFQHSFLFKKENYPTNHFCAHILATYYFRVRRCAYLLRTQNTYCDCDNHKNLNQVDIHYNKIKTDITLYLILANHTFLDSLSFSLTYVIDTFRRGGLKELKFLLKLYLSSESRLAKTHPADPAPTIIWLYWVESLLIPGKVCKD